MVRIIEFPQFKFAQITIQVTVNAHCQGILLVMVNLSTMLSVCSAGIILLEHRLVKNSECPNVQEIQLIPVTCCIQSAAANVSSFYEPKYELGGASYLGHVFIPGTSQKRISAKSDFGLL